MMSGRYDPDFWLVLQEPLDHARFDGRHPRDYLAEPHDTCDDHRATK